MGRTGSSLEAYSDAINKLSTNTPGTIRTCLDICIDDIVYNSTPGSQRIPKGRIHDRDIPTPLDVTHRSIIHVHIRHIGSG